MTTLYPVSVQCAVCGQRSNQTGIGSSNQMGAPDLDLRPPEMLRSTLPHWVQECPHCGYVAPSLEEVSESEAQVVRSAPYRTLLADAALPPHARRFLLRAMILEDGAGDLPEAAEETLHAAWAAEDANRPDLAASLRRDAVALYRAGPAVNTDIALRIVDMLRRAGDFEGAGQQAGELGEHDLDEAMAEVLAFQQKLIAAQDDRRYTIGSALPPPATRPHVTHRGKEGRPRKPFGRREAPPPPAAGPEPGAGGFLARLRRLFGGGR